MKVWQRRYKPTSRDLRGSFGCKVLQNTQQAESKVREHIFARKLAGLLKNFDFSSIAVDFYSLVLRVDEPAETGAVGEVFAHLFLENGKVVGIGPQFDNEVRAERDRSFALCGCQGVPFVALHPGGVGGAGISAGQLEAT